MARQPMAKEKRDAIVRDWEFGIYKNFSTLAKAHGISSHTSKKIVTQAKAIQGCRADEYKALKDSTKEFIVNPTAINAQKRELAKSLIPITDLFDMEAIEKHTNGLVAKEIMEELEEELIKSTLILINARANHNVRQNTKTISMSGGKGMGSYTADVPLDSGDLKNYVDLVDKSIVALGLAPRHAPKSGDVNILNQQGLDGTSVVNSLDGFYEEDNKVINE